MKLLPDADLSPRLVSLLTQAGHDVTHVFDLGMGEADDETILARALVEERAVATVDTDFVTMPRPHGCRAAVSRARTARHRRGRVAAPASLVLANVAPLAAEIRKGCIVVVEADRVRVRSLPIERRAPRKTRGNSRTGRHEAVREDPPHAS